MNDMFSRINAHLGIRVLPASYPEYTRACYEHFIDPRTLVFVDTNILGLPFRFHSGAREGFFSLLAIPSSEKRLVVPGWASNEFFFRAFKANGATHGFTSSVTKQLAAPSAANVRETLSRVISDQALATHPAGHLGRKHVIEELSKDIETWSASIAQLGKDLDAEAIHAELLRELDGSFRSLDFSAHNDLIERVADRRRANRIPPGLSDGKKGDVGSRGVVAGNVDGDLALWLEILAIAKAEAAAPDVAGYDHVIVLCQERKDDFLYTPPKRLREPEQRVNKDTPTDNKLPPIKLPDPRLVSEFENAVGHRSLAFITMEELAHGSLAVGPNRLVGQFVQALTQQNDTDAAARGAATVVVEPSPLDEIGKEPELPAEPAESGPDGLVVPEAAKSDERAYIGSLPDGVPKDLITRINTHNWYVQNPAVLALKSERIPADVGTAFVLGRAVYQAADGNAWSADEFLRGFDAWATEPTIGEQAFVAGAAYEMLFDGKGVLRDLPKTGVLQAVMALLQIPRWEPAKSFIDRELRMAGRPLLPPETKIRIDVVKVEKETGVVITDAFLKIGERAPVSLKATGANDDLRIRSSSLASLVSEVADFLLIDEDSIEVAGVVPSDQGLRISMAPELVLSLAPVSAAVKGNG